MSGTDLKFSLIFEIKHKVLAEIHNLDNKKPCQESDMQLKINRWHRYFSEFIFHNFLNSISDMTFSSELKNAEDVENYSQVSILPNFSKIYEMYLYDQMR